MIKSSHWFTLVELVVVITLIGILIVWASNINFNPQIDRQNAEMFTNNVFTNIETIRNNSLLGKWIWSWAILTHPKKWTVNINSNATGSIYATYTSGSIRPVESFSVDFINQYSKIAELKCESIDGVNSSTGNSIQIDFSWNTLSFTGNTWCTSDKKILKIKTQYKNFDKTIKINSITWLIEKL